MLSSIRRIVCALLVLADAVCSSRANQALSQSGRAEEREVHPYPVQTTHLLTGMLLQSIEGFFAVSEGDCRCQLAQRPASMG